MRESGILVLLQHDEGEEGVRVGRVGWREIPRHFDALRRGIGDHEIGSQGRKDIPVRHILVPFINGEVHPIPL